MNKEITMHENFAGWCEGCSCELNYGYAFILNGIEPVIKDEDTGIDIYCKRCKDKETNDENEVKELNFNNYELQGSENYGNDNEGC